MAKLGEPSIKKGGGATDIVLTYEYLGIDFTLNSKVWTQYDAQILNICLY